MIMQATVNLITLFAAITFACSMPARADLPDTLLRVKPAVVAIGTYVPTRSPSRIFSGTGFVVGEGLTVVTNAHVLPSALDADKKEQLIVIAGTAERPQARAARVIAQDPEHDIALLRIDGEALPALALGDSDKLREGASVAFTGFPLGMVLGFHAATHRGIVAAVTPYIAPAVQPRQLDAKAVKRLANPFPVFQLDVIAYPGNSGSPMYDPETGIVYGVLNSVFVKESKENLLNRPSGITYVIPGNYIRALLTRIK